MGRVWLNLAPGPIVATDRAFSSNRFAWVYPIHKLNLWVELELKAGIVPTIAKSRLRRHLQASVRDADEHLLARA
jgi:hypothetical protein